MTQNVVQLRPGETAADDDDDDGPDIKAKATATGGDINDIITLSPASRRRVESIQSSGRRLQPLTGMYTTLSSVALSVRHLDTIIAEAKALRREIQPLLPPEEAK